MGAFSLGRVLLGRSLGGQALQLTAEAGPG